MASIPSDPPPLTDGSCSRLFLKGTLGSGSELVRIDESFHQLPVDQNPYIRGDRSIIESTASEVHVRSRREFLKSLGTAAAMAAGPARPIRTRAQPPPPAARIRFAAIGLNHSHITGQVEAAIRGGGRLVSFFAKEPDLAAAFAKRFPSARLARSEREILEDATIQLVVSASIPNERAPLGVQAMQHGKDFMVDKPGATSLEQLAQLRRVQAETKRIYSVLIERHESKVITTPTQPVVTITLTINQRRGSYASARDAGVTHFASRLL
jgi:hypothetical protein